jgi:hypothetical protein
MVRTGRRGGVCFGAAMALTVLVAACSSGGSKSSSSSSASAAAPAGTSATEAPATTAASSSGTDQLSALNAELGSAVNKTFKATYTANENGQTSTITIEQSPPKSVFVTPTSRIISTGTSTYICQTAGQVTCITETSGNPLAPVTALFDPKTVHGVLHGFEQEAAAHAVGVTISYSSKTIAGLPATCVTGSASGHIGTYCVTKNGVLAYVQSGANSFVLTSFSSIVPSSDFSLPAGATVVTT